MTPLSENVIYFVTGSEKKLGEAQVIMPEIQSLDAIDLPEIQEMDAEAIIQAKLKAAYDHLENTYGPMANHLQLVVEDSSLYFNCLNGLPGPLIKWFLKRMGNEGLAELAHKYADQGAQAVTYLGYGQGRDQVKFFKGEVQGTVIRTPSQGEHGFGWDKIFQPEGHALTYADMPNKNDVSMRMKAFRALQAYLAEERK